jgi:pimeloyl-ACP methyl ester carboxylesterase
MFDSKVDLVLIPGLLCSPALWQAQIRGLSDIANISVADHMRHDDLGEIAAAILTTAPAHFALAGLSMGGYIAFEILRQAPDRVTRLALLDTSARADPPERRQHRLHLIALAEAAGAERAQQELLPSLVHRARLTDQALIEAVLQMATDTGVAAFKRQQAAIMARPDNRPLLASIRCPTLVLVGCDDALTPPALAREIAEGIAEAELEIVAECGHLASMEQPEAVNRAMRAWLGV